MKIVLVVALILGSLTTVFIVDDNFVQQAVKERQMKRMQAEIDAQNHAREFKGL